MAALSSSTSSRGAEKRSEAGILARLAAPIVATQLLLMALNVVDLALVGRVGVEAFDGVALGNVWKIGTLFVAMGLVFGADPLISQAHGAGDARGVALGLQRSLVIALLASLPVMLAWSFTEDVLLAFGQEPAIARIAHEYVGMQMFSVAPFLIWTSLRQYVQCRGIVAPILVVALLANVVNALLDWILIFGNWGAPALGPRGAGLATGTVQAFLPLALLGVIRWRRLHVGAWIPWSRASIDPRALLAIAAVGAPIALQFACEIWAFQIAALWAGLLGQEELAANSIVLNLSSVSFMLPLGVSLAAVTRVGNLVGERRFVDAQRAAWMSLALGVGAMALCAIAFLLGREALPRAYGAQGTVVALCASVLPIAAAFQLFDGCQVVGAGILRGMGRTRPAAIFNFVGYYALGLPLGWWLAFERGYGLAGLWWGIAVGLASVALPLVVWVARFGPARMHR